MNKSAHLSKCGTYRYSLTRQWGDDPVNRVCWIMLNPSTADAETDDPTIRRCISFSQGWGYDALVVVNLWPLRATDPKELRPFLNWENNGPDWWARDQIHFANLPIVLDTAHNAPLTIAAWGANAMKLDSGYVEHVLEELDQDVPANWSGLHCLGTTKDGSPKHPLYVKGGTIPVHLTGYAGTTALEDGQNAG